MLKISSKRQRQQRRRFASVQPMLPPGSSPGQLVADPAQLPTRLSLIGYGPEGCEEINLTDLSTLPALRVRWPLLWLNVSGLGDTARLEEIGRHFKLHRLVLEDILTPGHRPKVEDYDDYLFLIVMKGVIAEHFEAEQISLLMGEGWIISFQAQPGAHFDLVRERIRGGQGKIRQFGSDYLTYALLDAIADGYYPVLDTLNLRLERLEAEIIADAREETVGHIHHIKSDLLFLHRAVWPMRDVLKILAHNESPFITVGTVHYIRDCLDQTIQITELCEFYRDIADGLMHTFLAYSGHKANEIMKMLTMVSAIFIPLSFIAGLYGMNFSNAASPLNMPELGWYYGYPMALAIMLTIATGMMAMFYRRGWLGASDGKGRKHG